MRLSIRKKGILELIDEIIPHTSIENVVQNNKQEKVKDSCWYTTSTILMTNTLQ